MSYKKRNKLKNSNADEGERDENSDDSICRTRLVSQNHCAALEEYSALVYLSFIILGLITQHLSCLFKACSTTLPLSNVHFHRLVCFLRKAAVIQTIILLLFISHASGNKQAAPAYMNNNTIKPSSFVESHSLIVLMSPPTTKITNFEQNHHQQQQSIYYQQQIHKQDYQNFNSIQTIRHKNKRKSLLPSLLRKKAHYTRQISSSLGALSRSSWSPLLSLTSSQSSPPNLEHYVDYGRRPTELAQTKCHERCSCKWRSGKIWVECLATELSHIPRGLDTGTQVLYLSGNPLRLLEANVFEQAELRNLQRLHLIKCRLAEIDAKAFAMLTNLIEIDLSHNELTILPAEPLVHCPILRKLNLAHNRIEIVRDLVLQRLTHLQTIDMSSNSIAIIERQAFAGVKNLKQLYLHENKLK